MRLHKWCVPVSVLACAVITQCGGEIQYQDDPVPAQSAVHVIDDDLAPSAPKDDAAFVPAASATSSAPTDVPADDPPDPLPPVPFQLVPPAAAPSPKAPVPAPAPPVAPQMAKFGDFAASWLALYDLTGHALVHGTGFSDISQFVTPLPDGGVQHTMHLVVTGQAGSGAPGGTVAVTRQAAITTAANAVQYDPDTIHYLFDHFRYQHPCMSLLEITGEMTCSGQLTWDKNTGAWNGAHACESGNAGIAVVAVGNPHTLHVAVTRAIDGPLGDATAVTLAGDYLENGAYYPFPATVPPAVTWCTQ